jgi:hypothetical protein
LRGWRWLDACGRAFGIPAVEVQNFAYSRDVSGVSYQIFVPNGLVCNNDGIVSPAVEEGIIV